MMRLDHFVIHIDKDQTKLESLRSQIEPIGFPFNPHSGKGTKGFQVANIWIGDQYLELVWLRTKDGGGWRGSSPYLCVNSPSVRIPHSFPRRGRRRKHAPCSPSLAVWHAQQRIAGQFNSVLSNCLSRPNGTLRGFDRLR